MFRSRCSSVRRIATSQLHEFNQIPKISFRNQTWRALNTGEASLSGGPSVIFSGIQPTGVPHIGNYLGALKQWVDLQNQASRNTNLLFCIVDLHSLTSRLPAEQRRKHSRDMLAAFLAVGLDPNRATLFYQSAVPAHTELHWILSCDASMGWLSRMTQWKNKLSDEETLSLLKTTGNSETNERTKLGLFSYPVLQAADILLYQTTHVPVGEDQLQHVEFSRGCAQRFNSRYGTGRELLRQPRPLLSAAKRVMSLQEPTKKMSKSHTNPKSRILITDSAEAMSNKFRVALTDSESGITYQPGTRPGVANIIEIISHFDKQYQSCEEVAKDFKDSSLRALKERATTVVSQHLEPVRQRYLSLTEIENDYELLRIAEEGGAAARIRANETMELIRQAVGL